MSSGPGPRPPRAYSALRLRGSVRHFLPRHRNNTCAVLVLVNRRYCSGTDWLGFAYLFKFQGRRHREGFGGLEPPDCESYCFLCSRMVRTFRSLSPEGWISFAAGCCTTSVGSPAGRSLSRSSEDGLSIPIGWFATMTTSGVTELLARASVPLLYSISSSPSPKFVSTHLVTYCSRPGERAVRIFAHATSPIRYCGNSTLLQLRLLVRLLYRTHKLKLNAHLQYMRKLPPMHFHSRAGLNGERM